MPAKRSTRTTRARAADAHALEGSAIDANLEAFIDAAIAAYGPEFHRRINVGGFDEAKRLLNATDCERTRYGVAIVQKIAAYEDCFDDILEGRRPARQFKGPKNPGIRATYLSELAPLLFRRSLPLSESDLVTILHAIIARSSRFGELRYPVTGIVRHIASLKQPISETLRDAITRFASRVAKGHSTAATKAAVAQVAAGLAPAKGGDQDLLSKAVKRGFTGHPAVLRAVKVRGELLPDEVPPGSVRTVGPDRFPLRDDSPLAKEHQVVSELYEQWNKLPNYGKRFIDKTDRGQKILGMPPEQRGRVLLALGERYYHGETTAHTWEDAPHQNACGYASRLFQPLLETNWTLSRDLYFDLVLITSLIRERFNSTASDVAFEHLLEIAERFQRTSPLNDEERYSLSLLRVAAAEGDLLGCDQDLLRRLTELIGDGISAAFSPGAVWVDLLHARASTGKPERRAAWLALLRQCLGAASAKPTAKWLATAATHVKTIGAAEVAKTVAASLSEFVADRTDPIWKCTLTHHRGGLGTIAEPNATGLKGLVWLASTMPHPDLPRIIRATAVSAYRKIPGIGPRAVSLGNACVYALSKIGDEAAVGQLAMLKARVKFGTAQREIDKAFNAVAAALGLPREDIEELGVPAYGLEDVGVRKETFGDAVAELHIDGRDVDIHWTSAGKPTKAVPAKVKTDFKDDLKELQTAAKDIAAMLPVQAERIDSMFLLEKRWTLDAWQQRYLDHPLVGTVARRLIWTFTQGRTERAGIWHDGRLVDAEDRTLSPGDGTEVRLWHPIGRSTDEVLAWRSWLDRHQVRQPFKQAHREIYVLTDAERNTRTYSNRFAAHIVRQHQFNALCAARGWRNKLRLMVDADYPPATKELPVFALRAEYWVEGIGDDYGTDTTDSGAYLRLATDQVRFYRTGAAPHYAHASGGGYTTRAAGPGQDNLNEPLALDQIPPLVLSEIMRDVDLFVGVASVGNDPTWQDGGPGGRYQTYWQGYSFGELTETAKTRREVLETLLPRLKIRDRATLSDRFLIVRGQLRTYKIHLGSGNILMEPNDEYLCIVPARGAAASEAVGNVFLPFEGDTTLSVIISKALLLAEDTKITDPTITGQIKHKKG